MGEKSHYLLSDYLHLVKEAVENAAEDGVAPEKVEELKQQMKAEMEAEFQLSKERDYQDCENFFGKFGLSEHFYGEDIDAELPVVIDKVCGNLDRFIASKWNDKVQDYFQTAKFVYVERPRIPNFEAMRMDVSKLPGLGQVSVFASPDF